MLHTYSKVFKTDVVLLIVRLAVLAAVTLTVPVVLFPVSGGEIDLGIMAVTRMGLFMNVFSSVDSYLRQSAPVCVQGIQLDSSHHHHPGLAGRNQRPGHPRPHHQGHLWLHR